MSTPKTVTMFVIDGTPAGRIKCTMSNWHGQVYLIPRTELSRSASRPELQHAGVYILVGNDPETDNEQAYVGQAGVRQNGNGVLDRINFHKKSSDKDYFTHAVVITTADNSFGPTEISHLEHAFYQLAVSADRVVVVNERVPSPGNVTEEKQSELDEFIEYALIAIGTLGYRIFDKPDTQIGQQPESRSNSSTTSHSTDNTLSQEPLLYLRASSAVGTGRQTPDGFVVFAESRVRDDMTRTVPESTKLARKKYADRIEDGILTSDIVFTSPSAAAQFLMGSSASGNRHWTTADGVTLGDLEREEAQR